MAIAAAPFCEHPVNCAGGVVRLGLQAFRNYSLSSFDTAAKYMVLIGPNGVGKTNILEALSLLGPGRGMRSARPEEWRRIDDHLPWKIVTHLEEGTRLATGAPENNASSARRFVTADENNLTSQAELADYLAVVWLTPQMDGLFLDDASARRKFIDRLVYAAHPEHAVHLQRYDHALKQRNKLLKDKADPSLIRSLHPVLVSEGVAIAASRLEKTDQLNAAFVTMETPFPLPHLEWTGVIENMLRGQSARLVEDAYLTMLENNLAEDRMIGQTRRGVHRSDVIVTHTQKNIAASQGSTGEQKALLLSLVLAHAAWLKTIQPHRPLILLLDEIAAHLDAERRAQVFAWLDRIDAQVWLTGTDEALFAPLQKSTGILRLA